MRIDLTLYTYRRLLYGLCTSLAHTNERRFQIDLLVVGQVYK